MRPRIPHATVVRLLAVTLGDERARGTWADAVKGLGIPLGESYERDQVASVLSALANAPGLVGNASRVARGQLDTAPSGEASRVKSDDDHDGVHSEPPPSTIPRLARLERKVTPGVGTPSTSPAPSGIRVDLLAYLVPSLGDEKAREVLQQYSRTLGVRADSLSREDAVGLLEAMSNANGLLGVVARFAKARLLLKHPTSRAG